jgi:hypothetical protein
VQSYGEIVDDLCARYAHVEPGKMFGMDCFKANGKAAGGRPMKEWVVVPASQSRHRAELAQAAVS